MRNETRNRELTNLKARLLSGQATVKGLALLFTWEMDLPLHTRLNEELSKEFENG